MMKELKVMSCQSVQLINTGSKNTEEYDNMDEEKEEDCTNVHLMGQVMKLMLLLYRL